MVQISSKFIADLKAFAELDIRLKEFNSFTGMKEIVQIPTQEIGKKHSVKKEENRPDDTKMTKLTKMLEHRISI